MSTFDSVGVDRRQFIRATLAGSAAAAAVQLSPGASAPSGSLRNSNCPGASLANCSSAATAWAQNR